MAATAAAPDVAAAALLADALPEVAVVGLPTRRLAELPAALAATAKPLLVCGVLSARAGGRRDRRRGRPGRDATARRDRRSAWSSTAPRRPTSTRCSPALAPALPPPSSPAGARRRGARRVAPRRSSPSHAAALAACAVQQLAAPGAPYLVPALPGGRRGARAGLSAWARPASPPSPSSPSLRAHAGLPIAAGFPPTRPAGDEWLAAADGTFFALAAALGGAALLAVAGHTDGGTVYSPAQLVLDAETWSNVRRDRAPASRSTTRPSPSTRSRRSASAATRSPRSTPGAT